MILGTIRVWEMVVIIAGVLAIIDIVWTKGIVRVYRLLKAGEHAIDVSRTLAQIAEQFEPNDGSSLLDRIVKLENNQQQLQHGQAGMQTALEELTNRIDTFIIDRHPGGRRHTDPNGN